MTIVLGPWKMFRTRRLREMKVATKYVPRFKNKGCQPAFRVGPTIGPLSVSDRSKCYLVLLKVPRKLLTLRSL
jgi:hypothetical protein